MIICHCNGVSDRTIRHAVRGGAASCREIAQNCRAGVFCGGCRPAISELIREERNGSMVEVASSGLVAATS